MQTVPLLAGTALGALLLAAFPLAAQELPAPTDTPVLVISGEISRTNGDGKASFDRAMLEALDTVTFETTTIWTDGPQSFTGVPLLALLEEVGGEGSLVSATAINDYAVEIPTDSLTDTAPIVAYQSNGADMSVRDKGPLWVVYPYDSSPEYQTEVIYSRSIWQLDRIEVKN